MCDIWYNAATGGLVVGATDAPNRARVRNGAASQLPKSDGMGCFHRSMAASGSEQLLRRNRTRAGCRTAKKGGCNTQGAISAISAMSAISASSAMSVISAMSAISAISAMSAISAISAISAY